MQVIIALMQVKIPRLRSQNHNLEAGISKSWGKI